ncbi:TonB-dependent receptor [Pseudoxanthomonas sp. CF125]|uniref:TonB-dependent receptor n=1 Tax=Pseudoxanthomonas sp. CF125 TaxID=1855303 RepID=UPI00088BEC99|nr:TonB-dependent receptor [Pseudoxanthomonas sp. CF125]SDQ27745.1 Carboxypeptidase regulatory-like domain-containing protein [Pseudoxanthomonas sp. CF125]
MKNRKPRNIRPTRKLLTCALASCLTLSMAPAFAQSSNATLRGKAPIGAQVTAKNTATGSVRRVMPNADGSYSLVGLPPGTYQVDAGPGTEQTVTLSVATSVSLDLGGTAAAPATGDATTLDTVTVVAPPLTEVKTSEVGNNVSLKQINTVPQLTRNFLEFADTVPGMQFSTDSSGHSDIRGGAQTTSAVNVYIDGVGQKSYLFGGVSGQQQSAGNPFPQLAIGEYKVITSNYKAEFDQVGSAAIVAATKSGTNEFHGEVFGRHTDSSWRTEYASEKAPGKEKQKTHQNEYGFALGGPIIQDKMHFFVSYEGKGFILTADPVAVPDRFRTYADFLPEDVQSQFGPITRPFKEDLYFGKIDWEIGENDKLEFSAKIRDEESRDSVGGLTTASAAKLNDNTEERYDLNWEHYGEGYLNEFRITYEDVLFNPTAYTIGNQSIYTAQQNQNDVLIFSDATSGLAIQRKGQKGPSVQNDITFNGFEWNGDHVIKAGIKYKEVDLTQSENSTANPSFYYEVNDGSQPGPAGTSAIPYQVRFNLPFAGATPSVTTKSKQLGLYIQDDWNVTDKLQLNLGIRWDYEEIPSYVDHVTPPEVVAALTGPGTNPAITPTYAEQLALGGVDLADYISTGNNRKADKDNWAPRLGFSYDLGDDERHVIFGGAGRSYDRNLYDYMGLEQVKSALSGYTIQFSDTTGCTPTPGSCVAWDPSFLNGTDVLAGLVTSNVRNGEIDLLNNDLVTPYSDQFSLGMRNKIGEWNTSATIAYIHSKEGFVFTLGNRYPNGDFFQGGSQPWGHSPPGFGALIIGNNGIETKTKQLLLSADKPYTKESGWGVSAAYTFSDATGNRGGDEHYAFDAATIEQYPFIDLKAVPKHRLVLTGIYDLPWNITASAKLTLATPPPINEIVGGPYFSPPRAVAIDAPGTLGTKQLDLSLSKDFLVTEDVTVQVRGDLINATDADNFSGYTTVFGDGVTYNPQASVNRYGTQYTPPRTLFMSVRVIW